MIVELLHVMKVPSCTSGLSHVLTVVIESVLARSLGSHPSTSNGGSAHELSMIVMNLRRRSVLKMH